jgi:hypothetical protein
VVGNVVPYAIENLPKLIFVTKKNENIQAIPSKGFEVLDLSNEEY